MTNLTTPNKISVATVTDKTHPTKVKTDAPDGMSFGALLAQQVIDNAPSPETTPPMLAEGKDVLLATSSKSQDEKKPVTKNVSADLPANVIALLPPLQDIPLPATTETANGSKIAKTNLPNTLVRDIPAKAIDAPATKGLPGNAESDVIAAAPSNQASDLKKVPADSVNLAERLPRHTGTEFCGCSYGESTDTACRFKPLHTTSPPLDAAGKRGMGKRIFAKHQVDDDQATRPNRGAAPESTRLGAAECDVKDI
jgi:hypothetical protein